MGIAAGFALFGKPVLETIGKSITKLSHRSGFTAQFCAAATVLVCNVLGLPVSSSTVIVGGVAGVGLYNSKHRKKREKKNMEDEEEKKYKQMKLEEITSKNKEKQKELELEEENIGSFNNQDYFRLYLIIASGAVAFAHGGNDV